MKSDRNVKEIVKEKYGEIANLTVINEKSSAGCCTPTKETPVQISCCEPNDMDIKILGDEYSSVQGYVPEADLGLGCGIPTEFANIKKGDTVLDLGSGAGNDVFIARNYVGEDGWVIGVDMTEKMIERANQNKKKLGFSNVEFRYGDIENLPVEDNTVDVVVSNCVINLVPDKEKVYREIYRVLREGGHFCVSDIVTKGELPEPLKHSAELYAGCVSGASDLNDVEEMIRKIGFNRIKINQQKEINLQDKLLKKFLDDNDLLKFRKNQIGLYSITLSAYM